MTKNESVEFVKSLVTERHRSLCRQVNELIEVIAGDNGSEKMAKMQYVFDAAKAFKDILPSRRIPRWLEKIYTTTNFALAHKRPTDLLLVLIEEVDNMKQHEWFIEEEEAAFDFDAVYEKYKSESRLPELFNEIVRLLEEIERSDEVDSLMMIRGLGKVIATIKRCKDGSYFSINGAWEFLTSFLKNYLWIELTNIPALGTLLEALKVTVEDANEEMFKLHKNIDREMRNTVESSVKALANKTSFQFVAYDKSGHTLPAQTKLLTDTSA